MKVEAVAVLLAAVLVFGCIGGGGGGTPTPAPITTHTPAVTATPGGAATQTPAAETPTPVVTATPAVTPTPAGAGQEEMTWAELFGCARTGMMYAYRITTPQGTNEMEYRTSEGGMVGGVDTVKKSYAISAQGMEVTTSEWDTKVGCRCVKVETAFGAQVMPGQCPDTSQGGGEPSGAQTTITNVGMEQVSVPAYSGMATKYHSVTVSSGGTYSSDVWSAPGIPVPVKTVTSGATMELLRYSA